MKSSNKKELSTDVKYVISIIAAISVLETLLARFIYINDIQISIRDFDRKRLLHIYSAKHTYNEHTWWPSGDEFMLDCRPLMIVLVIILCLIAWHEIKRYMQSKTETDIKIRYLDMIAWNLIACATIAHTYQMLVYGFVVDFIRRGLQLTYFDTLDLQILAGIIMIIITTIIKIRDINRQKKSERTLS